MSEELKPCPFCGCGAVIDCYNYYFNATCKNCFVEVVGFENREDCIKVWNNRPIEDEKDKEIERLKYKLNNIKYTLTKYHDVSLSKINAKEAEGVHFFVFKFSSALLEIINDNK